MTGGRAVHEDDVRIGLVRHLLDLAEEKHLAYARDGAGDDVNDTGGEEPA